MWMPLPSQTEDLVTETSRLDTGVHLDTSPIGTILPESQARSLKEFEVKFKIHSVTPHPMWTLYPNLWPVLKIRVELVEACGEILDSRVRIVVKFSNGDETDIDRFSLILGRCAATCGPCCHRLKLAEDDLKRWVTGRFNVEPA